MGWIQQHYSIIGIVLAIITAVLTWLQLRKKDPSTMAINRSRVDHSPIISASHNQVNIGHAPSKATYTEQPKTERAIPNLVYAGAKGKAVFFSPWPRDGVCDPCTQEQRINSINALVLKFENRIATSDRKIAPALNVIAKLRFQHRNGATERCIDYGVWLNSPCNRTDIGIGDTRELVLVGVLDDKLLTFEDRRGDNRDFYSEGFSYADVGDIEGYERVDVTLIDQNTQATLSLNLKFWREGSNFCTDR